MFVLQLLINVEHLDFLKAKFFCSSKVETF